MGIGGHDRLHWWYQVFNPLLIHDFVVSLSKEGIYFPITWNWASCFIDLYGSVFSRGWRKPLVHFCILLYSSVVAMRSWPGQSVRGWDIWSSQGLCRTADSQTTPGHVRESLAKISRANEPIHSWTADAWVNLAEIRRSCPVDLQMHEQNKWLYFKPLYSPWTTSLEGQWFRQERLSSWLLWQEIDSSIRHYWEGWFF